MKRILITMSAFLLAALPLFGQDYELNCFISDPDVGGMTNIRSAPKGKIVLQVESADFYQLTVIVQPGGWWRIKDGILYNEGECEEKVPSPQAWIHRSVLAVATDYEDGQPRKLYAEPRSDSKRLMVIHEMRALLRPLELSADGKWVKVTYDPSEFEDRPCEKVTGWIEKSKVRDDAFEPGDGGPVPLMRVSVPGSETVICRDKPADSGKQTFVLEKGKTYEFTVSNPQNGWWQLWFGCIDENDVQKWVDDEAWMPASSLYMVTYDYNEAPAVPVYEKPDYKSRKKFDLKTGTRVHPVDFFEWNWVKVFVDGHPEQTGWIEGSKLTD
ncbi:MAG: hypothetical protein IKX53_06680 [Bacteroidales bacterium]|nr:hypothetical protein [Bacteroidales bacterium]